MGATGAVYHLSSQYIQIRLFGAPAVLLTIDSVISASYFKSVEIFLLAPSFWTLMQPPAKVWLATSSVLG
jgi:hypothetical protein